MLDILFIGDNLNILNNQNKRKVKGTNQNSSREKGKGLVDSKDLERNVLSELSNEFNNQNNRSH